MSTHGRMTEERRWGRIRGSHILILCARCVHPRLQLLSCNLVCQRNWKRQEARQAARGLTSLEKHVHVEVFRTSEPKWDQRSDKLHIKLPDFRHKITKEALWIDSSGTPEWVKRA